MALALVAVERAAWIAEPSAFGPVIDAFAEWRSDPTQLPSVTSLLIWIGLFAINSLVGAIRRSADPKIYGWIFADLAAAVSKRSLVERSPTAQTVARADLTREFIDFLRYRAPEALEELIGLGGALVGLAFYDWRLALTGGLTALPLAILTSSMAGRVASLQAEAHDMNEQSYRAFASEDPEQVRAHYRSIADIERRIGRNGAVVFGAMRVCLLVIFLVVLYLAIDLDNFTAGQIYSIVAYIWTFVTSSEHVPELAHSWTSLQDLSARMGAEDA